METLYEATQACIEPYGCLRGEGDFENKFYFETDNNLLLTLWKTW